MIHYVATCRRKMFPKEIMTFFEQVSDRFFAFSFSFLLIQLCCQGFSVLSSLFFFACLFHCKIVQHTLLNSQLLPFIFSSLAFPFSLDIFFHFKKIFAFWIKNVFYRLNLGRVRFSKNDCNCWIFYVHLLERLKIMEAKLRLLMLN